MTDQPKKPQTAKDYRALVLQFIASLCLCDHMGDVSNDVDIVLKRLGLEVEWGDFDELGRWCGKQGITTLYGTKLSSKEADE